MESELRNLFGKYGDVDAVVAKRSFNQTYCYAFIDFKDGEDATVAVEKYMMRFMKERTIDTLAGKRYQWNCKMIQGEGKGQIWVKI